MRAPFLPALLLTGGLLVGATVFGASLLQPETGASGRTPAASAPAQAEVVETVSEGEAAPNVVSAAPESAPQEAIPPAPEPEAALPPPPPPLPASASVSGIRHEYQRLNNCGPVTVGMALSRWGGGLDQYDIAPRLKPNRGDVNVSPEELASFARSQGMDVHLATNGDRPLLKRLLAAGYPVVVETWFVTHDSGGMGHYRLLTGYDDAKGAFSALDSYLGPLSMPYARFDELWRSFGRTFLVVSPPERAGEVRELLGFRANPVAEKREALRVALAEAGRRQDAVGWLNVGQAKLALGDARGAARAFDQAFAAKADPTLDPTRSARVVGGLPWRALWYTFGPLEAYTRTGRYADVLRLTGAVLRDAPAHEEALYWRGRALSALGRTAGAKAAYREAVRLRPGYVRAQAALASL
ncbi:C39 family peptidase [Deinococcus planocerae]|uniref:C39 family peptidase n=1 Tax=Deinococcus planocerae TaxID=1737569 RepID=UPI000C7F4A2A|nr:C39 family peptidase [Deinococcus planocerae]